MKLGIFEQGYELAVAWYDEDDGEGAWVGQDASTQPSELLAKLNDARKRRDEEGWSDYEYIAVEIAAQEWVKAHPDAARIDLSGYLFESSSQAKKFLAAMRAAAQAARHAYDTGVEWPDWAKKAQAAGWKPPKGWKP